MHRRKPRKSGRKGVVLSRPPASLSLCTCASSKSFLFFARTPMADETSKLQEVREEERERERGGFYPSSINDLANGSNVRLVTTLVNRAPPAESALPEKLRVSSSFTSHPTERKKNARDLFYRPSCNVSFPRATILQVPSYSISFARTGSSTSRLKGLDSKGRVIKIRMREFTDTFVGYVRDA